MFLTPGSRTQRSRVTRASLHLRRALSKDTTLYISTAGNDKVGDGSFGKPFATPEVANGYVLDKIDLNNHNITLQFADGTYPGFNLDGFNTQKGYVGQQAFTPGVTFRGNPSNTAAVVIDGAASPQTAGGACMQTLYANPQVIVYFSYITFAQSSDQGHPFIYNNSALSFYLYPHVGFSGGSAGQTMIFSASYLSIKLCQIDCNLSVSPDSFIWAQSKSGGVETLSCNVGQVGTPTFSTAFIRAEGGASANANSGSTFAAVNGKRYQVDGIGSIIDATGLGENKFPGTISGTVSRGGVYLP